MRVGDRVRVNSRRYIGVTATKGVGIIINIFAPELTVLPGLKFEVALTDRQKLTYFEEELIVIDSDPFHERVREYLIRCSTSATK